MPNSKSAALDIVQREEENNAMYASSDADRHASAGAAASDPGEANQSWDAANKAANASEEAATNASNLEQANK